MKIIKLTKNNLEEVINEAVSVLKNGGIVVYPTETIYGIGVNVENSSAVTRLLRYKNRPAGQAISVLVTDQTMAGQYVFINKTAENIYTQFLPGPVTVISDLLDNSKIDKRLVSELDTLGIRISSHTLASKLVKAFNKPITTTSSNASGKARPYSIETLLKGLSENQKEAIDLIIDAGELPRNDPSTVIDTTKNAQEILRAGGHYGSLIEDLIVNNEDETKETAKRLLLTFLSYLTDGPILILLEGEMGSGKTIFAKGLAEGLGITKIVNSPTFNLLKTYQGKTLCEINGTTEEIFSNQTTTMAHFDLWRLETASLEDLCIEDYLRPGNIVVIEWPKPVFDQLIQVKEFSKILQLNIDVKSENVREIKVNLIK